jgi:tellurite resistance protein TerC
MLAFDLVAHRHAHVISVKEAGAWSIFWVLSGITFGFIIWAFFGAEYGQQYFSGFTIEKTLAVDNVFIWAVIFASLGIPAKYQHRVLFLGVLGALVFRGIFIAAGVILINNFTWILYVFAAFLVFTGIRMLIKKDDHSDPTQSRFYRFVSKRIRVAPKFYGQRFLVRKGGLLFATPLLITLILVEFTDIIFAVDSIPAIFAVTQEPFLVFTANAFAILGLRAMYFLLADLVHRFVYLQIGLAAVLIWVGIKMALHDVFKVPTLLSLAVIIAILGTAIIASLVRTRGQKRHQVEVAHTEHFDEGSSAEISELEPVFRRRSRAKTPAT